MNEYKIEDYINYRLQRAKDTIGEVEILIENHYWNTAINRMYYACFYAVNALLIKHGVETASHSGARQQFGKIFVKTGKINKELAKHFSELFEKRQKGDYNDFFDYDQETVLRLYPLSKEFMKEVEILIKE